jgi:hypothetical protein
MFRLIKTYNNVIYRKYKKEMILYFFGMQVYLTLHAVLLVATTELVEDGFARTFQSLNPMDLLKQCLKDRGQYTFFLADALHIIIIEFSIIDLFNCFIVFYVKSNSDRVISFSKLDDLIVLSSF